MDVEERDPIGDSLDKAYNDIQNLKEYFVKSNDFITRNPAFGALRLAEITSVVLEEQHRLLVMLDHRLSELEKDVRKE